MDRIGFLSVPPDTPEAQAIYDDDQSELGYVMNVSRLWAYQPETVNTLFDLMRSALSGAGFTLRQRGILVCAAASTLGDSYCSLAWGSKLSGFASPALAAGVINHDDDELADDERVMADWARKVVGDPNATSDADLQALRDAGFNDSQIFSMTVFVALRLAFSSVNDALGATPDARLRDEAPEQVVAAVDFGRPVETVHRHRQRPG
jgi:uncharacterized peroxidase-related enzyme